MATKNQIRGMLRRKKATGTLPPQECPKCREDLSDPDVPEEFRQFAALFGVAIEFVHTEETAAWRCPNCLHVFGIHAIPDDLKATLPQWP